MEALAYELNKEGARLAREAAAEAMARDGKRRFVAGAVGPTNRTASISPDVNNPGFRAVSFDDLAQAYGEQIRGLIDGGAELILIETIFDTLNAKAAVYAANQIFAESGNALPIMISGTITDLSGRTLSGQTRRPSGIRCAMPILHDRAELRPWRAGKCGRISPKSPALRMRWSAPIPMPACRTNSAFMTRARQRQLP